MKIMIDSSVIAIPVSHAVDSVCTDSESEKQIYAEKMYAYAVDHCIKAVVTADVEIAEVLKNSGIKVHLITID